MGVWRGVLTAFSLCMMASSAVAAPCEYDVSPLPVVQGVVIRLTDDGAVLRDGTILNVPEGLRSAFAVGKATSVRGLIASSAHKVQVFAVNTPQPDCEGVPHVARGPYPGSPQYDALQSNIGHK
nr:hypothetical protein [uncultured Neokomagataea sp.]